jgi:hypothetical protein
MTQNTYPNVRFTIHLSPLLAVVIRIMLLCIHFFCLGRNYAQFLSINSIVSFIVAGSERGFATYSAA